MGKRKRESALKLKEQKKVTARLREIPTSPRKMRLVADMVRGLQVDKATYLLEHSPQYATIAMAKLLKSAVSNWEIKNVDKDITTLYIKEVFVDGGTMLKRLKPAPQGRGHRIRRRSNHITIVLDNK